MKCVICKQAETTQGTTTVTLSRGDATLVVRDVPAQICPNCGEDFVDSTVAASLEQTANAFQRSGMTHDVRRYELAV